MSVEDTTEASQEEQELNFSDDALDKAAEEFGESEEFTEHTEEVEARGEETEDPEDPEDTGEEAESMEASEEQEEEAEVPPEPSDNGERSKLGRKVKYIEDTVLGFQEQFEERMNRLDSLITSNTKLGSNEYGAESGEEEEYIGTKTELKKFLNDYNRDQETQKQSSQLKYEKGYINTIMRLGSEETKEDHQAIYDEMMRFFNAKHSDDPMVDAEKNYLNATRSVLKKRLAAPAKKVNPLKGNKPKAPLGAGNNSETMAKKTRPIPKFDDAAQDFMNKAGISPERAAEILDGEAPANLGRR